MRENVKNTQFKIWLLVSLLPLFSFEANAHAGSDSDRVKENISTVQKTKSCPGCDLSGADLNRMDLSGANLQGADLTDAKLYLVNFSGADLQNAHLQRASLGGADLTGADLRGADLSEAELNGAYLKGAKFDGEFVKTKPYEEEGTPEIEKKSNVDDTVKPEKSVGKLEEKADHKIVNIQKATHDQKPDKSGAPPVKTDEPIKDILVSENLVPSTDVHDQTDQDKNVGPAKEDRDKAKPIATAPTLPSHDTKSLPATRTNEGQERAGNTQNITGGKMSVEEDSSIKTSGKEKALVEKDLLIEKQEDKEKISVAATMKSEEISGDKANTVKKLLKTKKCYQCDLAGVDLSDKNLGEADLEGANLTGSNLEKADLSKAVLKGAVLVGANLKKANLKGADLYRANLSGADLTEANMENATVDGTLFVGAIGR